VLASLRDASELLRGLLEGGNSIVAGRLAGAFQHMGRAEHADEIVAVIKSGNSLDPNHAACSLKAVQLATTGLRFTSNNVGFSGTSSV
jgi:hypothetical protein